MNEDQRKQLQINYFLRPFSFLLEWLNYDPGRIRRRSNDSPSFCIIWAILLVSKATLLWCNCFFTSLVIPNMMLLYFEKWTMFTTQSCTRLKSRKLSWRGKGPLVRLHCLHSTYSVQLSKYLWYPVEKHQNSPKSLTLHDPYLSYISVI